MKFSGINEHLAKKIGKRLNGLIRENLYGTPGDPDWFNMFSAYVAYKTLKDLNLPVDSEKDFLACLEESDHSVEEIENHWNYVKLYPDGESRE